MIRGKTAATTGSLAFILTLLLIGTGLAGAQSADSAYTENVPSGGGNVPTFEAQKNDNDRAAQNAAANGGTDDRSATDRVLGVIASRGASDADSGRGRGGSGQANRSGSDANPGSTGPQGSIPDAVQGAVAPDASGLGWVLPAILLLTVVAANIEIFRRRRSRGDLGGSPR